MEKIKCDVDGVSGDRLHRCWRNMHYRCTSKKHEMHKYYVNVSVCDDWRSYEAFSAWAMANGYEDDLTIDRIDNDGDYCPANCQWTTPSKNSRNTRRAVMVTLDGVDMPLADACDLYSVAYNAIYTRHVINGWDIKTALTAPIKDVAPKRPKMSYAQIMRVVVLRREGFNHREIATKMDTSISIVQNILSGKTSSKLTGIKKRTKK